MAGAAAMKQQTATSPPVDVAGNALVTHYYVDMKNSPDGLYRYYEDVSQLSRPDQVNGMTTTTTIAAIKEKISSLGYGDFKLEISSMDSQASHGGGLLVLVTGYLTGKKDKVRKNFAQSLFLAPKAPGYFVLNDVFRFMDSTSLATEEVIEAEDKCVSGTNVAAKSGNTPDREVPDGMHTVFVSGLPFEAKPELLQDEFSKFGSIVADGVEIRQENGMCVAFVEFEEATAAQSAVDASSIRISGRQVLVLHSHQTTSVKPSKKKVTRRQTWPHESYDENYDEFGERSLSLGDQLARRHKEMTLLIDQLRLRLYGAIDDALFDVSKEGRNSIKSVHSSLTPVLSRSHSTEEHIITRAGTSKGGAFGRKHPIEDDLMGEVQTPSFRMTREPDQEDVMGGMSGTYSGRKHPQEDIVGVKASTG